MLFRRKFAMPTNQNDTDLLRNRISKAAVRFPNNNRTIHKKRTKIPTMFSNIKSIRAARRLVNRSYVSKLAAALLVLSIAGCSTVPSADYSKLGLVDVSGTITLGGVPLGGAVVTFEDEQTGQFSYGLTNTDGEYSLQLDSVQSGVVPGQKVVRISTTRKILGLNNNEDESSEEEGGEMEPDGKGAAAPDRPSELVPDKYNKKSELTADVSAARTTFDFDLKF